MNVLMVETSYFEQSVLHIFFNLPINIKYPHTVMTILDIVMIRLLCVLVIIFRNLYGLLTTLSYV